VLADVARTVELGLLLRRRALGDRQLLLGDRADEGARAAARPGELALLRGRLDELDDLYLLRVLREDRLAADARQLLRGARHRARLQVPRHHLVADLGQVRVALGLHLDRVERGAGHAPLDDGREDRVVA